MILGIIEGIKEAMFRPINKAASGILGVLSLLWGFWVANPFWSVFNSAEVYEILNWLAAEWVWGIIPMFIGFAMLFGMKRDKFNFLLYGNQAGFYYWLFASICFFIGDWHNTAGVVYLIIAIYSGYVALNLSINKDYYLET